MNWKDKIKRIQELRRSNAATPVRNKKKYTRKIKHKNKTDWSFNQKPAAFAGSGVSLSHVRIITGILVIWISKCLPVLLYLQPLHTKGQLMKLDEFKAQVEAQRKASLEEAIAKMSEANAKMASLFNLDEAE